MLRLVFVNAWPRVADLDRLPADLGGVLAGQYALLALGLADEVHPGVLSGAVQLPEVVPHPREETGCEPAPRWRSCMPGRCRAPRQRSPAAGAEDEVCRRRTCVL